MHKQATSRREFVKTTGTGIVAAGGAMAAAGIQTPLLAKDEEYDPIAAEPPGGP